MNIRAVICSLFCLNIFRIHLQLIYFYMKNKKCAEQRRWWVRPINQSRTELGFFNKQFHKVYITDHEEFYSMTRMFPDQFHYLCNKARLYLTKRSCRTPISVEERMALTLQFLAHGDSVRSKSWEYRIGKSTAHKIIGETCDAIWKALKEEYLPQPTKQRWTEIMEEFWNKWNFPNCIGALDGKHILIQAPPNSNSMHFNYKKTFSFILMAICDANYKFTWVDVGDYGSNSNGGVWANSELGKSMESKTADLPPPRMLPGTQYALPCTLVGDEAFPLKHYLMRPFARRSLKTDSERIFNYRLSRARRTIENSFGILVSRWRILRKAIQCKEETAHKIILALVVLHNFVMTTNSTKYCPPNFIDYEKNDGTVVHGEWRHDYVQGMVSDLHQVGSNHAALTANTQRNMLRNYFMSDAGSIPWQNDSALKGYNINLP